MVPLTYLPFLFAWLATCISVAFGQVGLIVGLCVLGLLAFISLLDFEVFVFMLACCAVAGVAVWVESFWILLAVSLVALAFNALMEHERAGLLVATLETVREFGLACFWALLVVGFGLMLLRPEVSALQIVMLTVNVLGVAAAVAVGYAGERRRKQRAQARKVVA